MTATTTDRTARPGVVTFIAVVIFVQAVLDAVAAIVTFVRMNDDAYQLETGLNSTNLAWTGIGYAAMAVILFFLSAHLRSGGRGARGIITFVWVVRMIWGVGLMVWYPFVDSAFHHGVIAVLVGWWVLWALHSHEGSREYFGDY